MNFTVSSKHDSPANMIVGPTLCVRMMSAMSRLLSGFLTCFVHVGQTGKQHFQ